MLDESLVENINVEKRNSIKNALIKGALFGGAVIGASSIVNASSVFWRTETGEMIDLKSGQSIKHTTSFGRTWTTGDSPYIKLKSVFLANESFVRVYLNNNLLTFGSDWSFNLTNGKKIGSVTDLTDGVLIDEPVNGGVYRVEFDEYIIPFSPMIGLCRTDGKMITKGIPRNNVNGGDGLPNGTLINIEETDNHTYTCNYNDGGAPFTRVCYYADRMFCINYPREIAFPTNWRMEVYKQGRNWSGVRASASGSRLSTLNCVMSPRKIFTTNYVNVPDLMFGKHHSGSYRIRMRNTVTNEVSLFSIQSVHSRRFAFKNWSGSNLGSFIKTSIK